MPTLDCDIPVRGEAATVSVPVPLRPIYTARPPQTEPKTTPANEENLCQDARHQTYHSVGSPPPPNPRAT